MEAAKGWWEKAVGVSCRLIRQEKGSRSAAKRPLLGKAGLGNSNVGAEAENAELSAPLPLPCYRSLLRFSAGLAFLACMLNM